MLKLITILALCFIQATSLAQTDNRPPYLQFPQVPPFRVTLVPDSTPYSKKDVDTKKAFVIFYFSPDCDHCIKATTELLSSPVLKKLNILMVSGYDFKTLQAFYEKFELQKFATIKLGQDPGNFFSSFYLNKSFPAVYAYKKKGKFDGEMISDGSVTAFLSKLL